MNICVFGGGGQPGKFGYDFCERARSDGHTVTVFSHRPQGDNITVDYNNVNDVVSKFENVIANAQVDLVLYNSSACNYANSPGDFPAGHTFDPQGWSRTLQVPVIVPHALAIVAQRHMPAGSAMVFMGSGMAQGFDRTHASDMAAYAGGKAVQTHLMIALAHNNSNNMIFSSIFPYLGEPGYAGALENIYNHLMQITPEWNGKVREIYR